MTSGREDDALSWGDDDPTLDDGGGRGADSLSESGTVVPSTTEPRGYPALPDGYRAVGAGSDALDTEEPALIEAAPAQAGNAALLGLGVLGGIYLLYTIGWVIGGLRLQGRRPFLVTDFMYQGSLWLAVLAPLLWISTTLVLARRSRPWVRFAWLVGGAALLMPWPFIMIGAVGQ
ncbi:DNA polymerase III subunit gamma/tau [Microbacterium sp. NPDC055357]